MAERERIRATPRTYVAALVRGTVAFGLCFAFFLTVRFVLTNVMSDLGWADRVPGPAATGVLPAAVGFILFVATLRAGGAVVAPEGARALPRGSRALAIYREQLRAASGGAAGGDRDDDGDNGDHGGGRGSFASAGAVNRWSNDLVSRNDRLPLEEGLS